MFLRTFMRSLCCLCIGAMPWATFAYERAGDSAQAASPPAAAWSFGGPLPGATPFDAALVQKLEAAWAARDPQYRPRSRYVRPDGSPIYTNRLFLESSPYLLQHAHNPVNWYPWGDEAFATAKALKRPVVVSIGYSTCHWCHVMEEESFDNEEIARYLNENYVAIKVDREERPDLDAVYMAAVQLLTGGGGWPMTVWLTPEREPFYGGTYFPAHDGDRGVPIGFLTLLGKLKQTYDDQPQRVAGAAADIAQAIRQTLAAGDAAKSLPTAEMLHAASRYYRENFDSGYGGLKRAPKFPSSLPVRFLLRYYRRTGDREALEMATLTLEKMAGGGLYDQVGGGFHRYSTDERWLIPHFEKMLYDNALLTLVYLEGYQASGREDFARIARETLRYLQREMMSPQGAFYSAMDADSLTARGAREEGWYYSWDEEEIDAALQPEQAQILKSYYGVTLEGNFQTRNVLHVARPLEELAREFKLSPEAARAVIGESNERLYAARLRRAAPPRDEKIVTAWNGLAISAFARAALVLGEPAYAEQAARVADFLLTHLREGGRLRRSYKDGQAHHNAYLADYAFLIAGLIDLYEVSGGSRWLREAIALDRVLEEHYEDPNGGYFMTSADHERLLAREKPADDGAEPSGNSVQALNLLRLYEYTTDDAYRQRAERTLRAFAASLSRTPAGLSEMLLAVDFHLDTPKEIVIMTRAGREEAEPFLARLRTTFLPNRVLAVAVEGDDLAAQAGLVPVLEAKIARQGKATAYVCERQVCQLPTADPEVFARQIGQTSPISPQR